MPTLVVALHARCSKCLLPTSLAVCAVYARTDQDGDERFFINCPRGEHHINLSTGEFVARAERDLRVSFQPRVPTYVQDGVVCMEVKASPWNKFVLVETPGPPSGLKDGSGSESSSGTGDEIMVGSLADAKRFRFRSLGHERSANYLDDLGVGGGLVNASLRVPGLDAVRQYTPVGLGRGNLQKRQQYNFAKFENSEL